MHRKAADTFVNDALSPGSRADHYSRVNSSQPIEGGLPRFHRQYRCRSHRPALPAPRHGEPALRWETPSVAAPKKCLPTLPLGCGRCISSSQGAVRIINRSLVRRI